MVEAGVSCPSNNTIARVALRSTAGNHTDGSGGAYFENAILVKGCDVVVAGTVHGNAIRVVEVGIEGRNTVGTAAACGGYHILCQRRDTHQERGQQKESRRCEATHEFSPKSHCS